MCIRVHIFVLSVHVCPEARIITILAVIQPRWKYIIEISTMPLEADPPIICDPPALAEMQAVVRKLKGGKAPGMCGIHGEFVKVVMRQLKRRCI